MILLNKDYALEKAENQYYLGYIDEYTKNAIIKFLNSLPPAQPEYEELTPEEAASEIASGSTMSAWYWLDDMMRLTQMGYAICRKR